MHEEASSSSTVPSSSKNILYPGSNLFNGNLLITTSQLPDPNSPSLYELIHQPAAPMHHSMTSKLVLTNNSLITTTTAPLDEFNAVVASSDLHDLAATDPGSLLDDSTSDAVAAAAALIDLHPSSSSSSSVAIPELATATSSSGSSLEGAGPVPGPCEPIEIKIPGSAAAAASAEAGDDGSSFAEGSSDGEYRLIFFVYRMLSCCWKFPKNDLIFTGGDDCCCWSSRKNLKLVF